MAELSDLFELSRPFEPNESAWLAVQHRASRRQRHRRVGSAALGLGMFLGAMMGLLLAFNRTVPVFGHLGQAHASVAGPAGRGRGSLPATTVLGSPQQASTGDAASATVAAAMGGGGSLVDAHDEHRQIVDARVVAPAAPGPGRGDTGDGASGSGTGDPPGAGAPTHGSGHGPAQGGSGPPSGGGAGGGSGGSGGSSGCGGGSIGHGHGHVRGPHVCGPSGSCNLV
jgi:hypothetical protein